MGLNLTKLQRLQAAIAAVNTKIANEKAAAIAEAAQERAAAEAAASLAAEQKSNSDTTLHLTELTTNKNSLVAKISSINSTLSEINTHLLSIPGLSSSASATTVYDTLITHASTISGYVTEAVKIRSDLDISYNNLKKAAGSYSSNFSYLATAASEYSTATSGYSVISTARATADSAVSAALKKLSSLKSAEDAASARAAAEASAAAALATQAEQTSQLALQVASAVNQNAFSYVTVPGHSNVTASTETDSLSIVAGDNISLSTNPTSKSITINANDTSVNWAEVQSKPSIPSITVSGNSIYITV